jgi:quercetin dioxygenase-like cupin family protein
MPSGKHNSSADPASGRDGTRDPGRDPAPDSARDPAPDSARGPGHGPGDPAHDSAGDPGGGAPDDVVMVEHLLAPGEPAVPSPPADHARYAYVLEGLVTARIGSETVLAGPGSILSIPRGCRHSLSSAAGTAARVVVVHVRETEPGDPQERRAA